MNAIIVSIPEATRTWSPTVFGAQSVPILKGIEYFPVQMVCNGNVPSDSVTVRFSLRPSVAQLHLTTAEESSTLSASLILYY